MSTKEQTTTKQKIKLSPLYNVVLHNDNTTTMDFVMAVLIQIFGHDHKTAFDIMMKVHEEGQGIAGTYSKEIAETHKEETLYAAKAEGYPLAVTVEEA